MGWLAKNVDIVESTAHHVDGGVGREEPKKLAPVSGFDLVLSRPKSVTRLHALVDDRVWREI